jgi:hypothetical protein
MHLSSRELAGYAGACHRAALCADPLGSNPTYAVQKTASGQPAKSESFDFGGAEFAPWVLGATM